jgi:hypothetical protein
MIDDLCEIHMEEVLLAYTLYSVTGVDILAWCEKPYLLWRAFIELPIREAQNKEYVEVYLFVSSL